MNTRLFAASMAVLLALLAAGTGALGGQAYRLKDGSAAGDVYTSDDTQQMDMNITAIAEGIEVPDLKFSMREREKYTETSLYERGQDWSIRRTYSIKRSFETTPDLEQKNEVSSLQGMTVTITSKAGKITITPAKGKLAAKDRQELLEELNDPEEMEFYPDRPVAVGEEWTITPRKLGPFTKAEVKARFEEVIQFAGLRCARVSVAMTGELQAADFPGTATVEVKGSVYHALDLHRDVAYTMAGPFKIEGKQEQDGRTIEMRGTGTAAMKLTRVWLKVAGKPVQRKS
jgi:hypothetical protein